MTALHDLDQDGFNLILNGYLHPSGPVLTEERLRGRDAELTQIADALALNGRHVFIFGDRGVGKTSLAMTAGTLAQSSDKEPVCVPCDSHSTHYQIVRDATVELLSRSPVETRRSVAKKLSGKLSFLGASVEENIETGMIPEPKSLAEAIALLRLGVEVHSKRPVIVIDEFERIDDDDVKKGFGELVKQLGDQSVELKLIFSGVGKSLEGMLAGHQSAYRYLEAVKLKRLSIDQLSAILEDAAEALSVPMDSSYCLRVGKISDGFPHFTHLIGTKIFQALRSSEPPRGEVDALAFRVGLMAAARAVEPYLLEVYEKATEKYSNDTKHVLWGMAASADLKRPTKEIRESYVKVAEQIGIEPMPMKRFYNRMNYLKSEACDRIIEPTDSGAGWYQFREPMQRGYCRLRATEEFVEVGREYYFETDAFTTQPSGEPRRAQGKTARFRDSK